MLLPVALGAALLASACGRGGGGAPAGADGPTPPWVSAEELKPLVAGGRAVVFDSRTRAAYRRGHITGAWSLPLEEVAPAGGEFDTRARGRLAEVLASTGFEPGANLIVTDGGGWPGMRRAAAGCWLLALAGARGCVLLTGGTDAWRAAGGELVTDDPAAPTEPRRVRIPARPPALASLEFVREATSRPEGAIADVRARAGDGLLAGGDALAFGDTRAAVTRHGGTIPGALPWPIPPPRGTGASGAAGGVLAPPDVAALERSAGAAGLFAERELVVVGDGLEDGALGWFLLRFGLGVRDAKLFPGGVAAWGRHPCLPFVLAAPLPVEVPRSRPRIDEQLRSTGWRDGTAGGTERPGRERVHRMW